MSSNDLLATALSNVYNAEKVGKRSCLVKPISKLIKVVLDIMKNNNYIGDIEYGGETKGGIAKINLLGNINRCGVIKPRYNIKKSDYEKFEKRFLLAKDFGFLIVSTSKGVMVHKEAKANNLGGRLIAYFY